MRIKNVIIASALVSALLLANVPLVADENADEKVFFVNTYSYVGWLVNTSKGLTKFKDVLAEFDIRLNHGLHTEISEKTLTSDIDYYVLSAPRFYLQDSDKAYLTQWVRNGGKLIIFVWWGDVANIGSYVKTWGITMGNYAQANNALYLTNNSPLSKPYPINEMASRYSRKINLSANANAIPLVKINDNRIVGAAVTADLGKGKILVFGCLDVFADGSVGGTIEQKDNKNFVRNVIAYLGDSSDLMVKKIKPKGRNLTAGVDFKLVTVFRNIGESASEETYADVYLSTDGTLTAPKVAPGETIEKLGTVNIPVINAGKKTKMKTTFTIPNYLGPGAYYIVIVVDPEETTNDSNTENNTVVSKKKLVIQ